MKGQQKEIHSLADLTPDSKNARKHTPRNVGMIEQALQEVGAARSIVIDENGVVLAGNATIEGAAAAGIEKVQVVDADGQTIIAVRRSGLSSEQKTKLALFDNRAAELATWDPVILQQQDIPLGAFWTDEEFKEELAKVTDGASSVLGQAEPPEPQLDRGEELRKQYKVELGQIWKLGEHRIGCLDCREPEAITKLLDGLMPTFVWADPPYGISIVATNVSVGGGEAYDIPFGGRKKGNVGGGEGIKASPGLYPIQMPQGRAHVRKGLGSADRAKPFGEERVRGSVGASNPPGSKNNLRIAPDIAVGKYSPIIGDETIDTATAAVALCFSLFPDALQVWWGANYYAHVLPPSSCWIVWDKQNTGNFADAELAWCSDKSAVRIFQHMWNGLMKASEKGERRVAPTQKPVALATWAFEKYGAAGDIILDPFLGSGMSVIAAEQMENRRVLGCELAPEYIAIIIDRWAMLTGKEPLLL